MLAEVERLLDHLYIAAEGAGLRDEDRKKAVEVAAVLGELARVASGKAVTLVDAAAGKAYVGLIAARLVLGPGSRVVAIERDERRRRAAEAAFAALEAPGIAFEARAGDVGDAHLWPEEPDLVVALHACGVASDRVLDRAVAARARRLWLIPCCYGAALPGDELARGAAALLGLPRHAPLRRRFAQAVIDAERALRLEAAGYETEVVELVAPTVTPHNLAFRARRVGEAVRAAAARERLAHLRAVIPGDRGMG
jgi:hypothetical protein